MMPKAALEVIEYKERIRCSLLIFLLLFRRCFVETDTTLQNL